MIDWFAVISAAIWILGLAILLAAFSIAYDTAARQHGLLRNILAQPAFRSSLVVGAGLFSLGLTLTVTTWWEKLGWIFVLILILADGVSVYRSWRHTNEKG